MKRLLLILICLLLMVPATLGEGAPGEIPQTALYEAYSDIKFHIRTAPEDGARKLKAVESGRVVTVYSYGKDWCYLSYGGTVGYGKTRWLYRFRSLNPFSATVPGAPKIAGLARVTVPVHAKVPAYGGNTLSAGDWLAVSRIENGKAAFPMMRGEAAVPAGALAFEAFVPWDKAQPGDVIGGFTTYYNETTGGRKLASNRRYNIELACSRVSGTVVPAGKTFSYNALCGPGTKANGYRLAPNISRDGVGYGGGICQLTTTIYNATLLLPLQIVEWSLHRDRGVAYIPRGFDAVVGSYSDFVFENTLPYPIQITALPQNGVLTVIIARGPA